ncbi:MAG: GNAT family N-acetyltransferase [Chloroflexi bacterium]|nr:GNAT family N-acetyltransferase [Chloroflexota bacterium]MCI0575319.1 GNAT family N-acetyltransferase [Chloroflexota bacterium]MCI0649784.1 GNAT family N-acetyltransferase [Chloroflexota bacterium]MCI0731462.1 GNAT family N-acetyltransferase [Chloroflexota bacterium]
MSISEEKPTVSWTIRAYQPGDERELVALFARVFGRSTSEDHWRWKLKQQPSPVENVWLAVDGDKPIFQYAGIPVRYQLPGGRQTALVSVDTMASPDYRRQGLLTKVGRFTYDRWREAGVPFIIGLPNEQWGSRAQALGWEMLFPLRWLIRPLYPEQTLARRLRWPPLGRLAIAGGLWNRWWDSRARPDPTVQVQEVDHAGPEFDVLWQQSSAGVAFSVVRDSAWVNWRYLQPPSLTYHVLLAERAGRPVGYLTYRLESGDHRLGFVAELFTAPADSRAQASLLHQAIQRLRSAGAEAVATLAVPETPLHTFFRQAGFRWSWGEFSVQLVPLAAGLPLEALHDRGQWFLAGGDFDVI